MTDSSKKFSYQDIATAAKTGFDWIVRFVILKFWKLLNRRI